MADGKVLKDRNGREKRRTLEREELEDEEMASRRRKGEGRDQRRGRRWE